MVVAAAAEDVVSAKVIGHALAVVIPTSRGAMSVIDAKSRKQAVAAVVAVVAAVAVVVDHVDSKTEEVISKAEAETSRTVVAQCEEEIVVVAIEVALTKNAHFQRKTQYPNQPHAALFYHLAIFKPLSHL